MYYYIFWCIYTKYLFFYKLLGCYQELVFSHFLFFALYFILFCFFLSGFVVFKHMVLSWFICLIVLNAGFGAVGLCSFSGIYWYYGNSVIIIPYPLFILLSICPTPVKKISYLFIWMAGGGCREREFFYLLVHFPMACNSWGWAGLTPRARSFIWI